LIREEAGDYVAGCASLAALLEVSAYPKPGNVHRTRDFSDTRFEHFLAGGVALGPSMRDLALRGFDVRSGRGTWNDIGVGSLALRAVRDTLCWQSGGNVNLGIILLFSPLAVAAGGNLVGEETIKGDILKENLHTVLHSTTPEDVIAIYEAINLSMTPRTLGKAEDLDVKDASSPKKIRDEGLTLQEVFGLCAGRDSICDEWVSDFSITFNVGLPFLKGRLNDSGDPNVSIVDTFLHLLSKYPDSLIARKAGNEKANSISSRAIEILGEGGASTRIGREMLWSFDKELHMSGGDHNPGTTADLTAASVFVLLLEGWKP
jgi:triphosphoribosyl-dephospho-CoA synthase